MIGSEQRPVRRSCLSVPGSSPGMMAKAFGLDADELALDLEDAVAVDAKDGARRDVVAALGDRPDQAGRSAVRVNAAGTPWCHLDLIAVAGAEVPPASVIVPKVDGRDDIAFVERLLDGVEAGAPPARPMRIQVLIESARGLGRATEIAAASPRIESLILGYADLGASLGRRPAGIDPQGPSWDAARDAVLVAARAAGAQAIDGPYLGVAVDDVFLAAARRARELGFDGKWAIHPSQVGALNEIFSPSAAEVDRARRIVAALEQAALEQSRGAVALDGEMLDEAVRAQALRVLARAGAPAPGSARPVA